MGQLTGEDYQTAAAAAGVGVRLWNLATGELTWSPRIYELYGVDPDFEVTMESFRARIWPEDRPAMERAIEEALRTLSDNFHVEHRVRLDDGRARWLEARGRVIAEDGKPVRMLGTAVDVTARLSAEARLRLFTQHATDYVYDANLAAGQALPEIVAGSFERTTGFSREQVVERGGWIQIIHPEDRESAMARVPTLLKGKSILAEYRIIDGSGQERWLRDRAVPVVDEDGVVRRLVGGVTDITEQRALEAQLARAQRNEALANLAGGVAHDFNNLLTVLMAEVNILQEEDLSPEARKQSLNELDGTLDRAAKLASSLLAFGRKDVGAVPVVDLTAVVLDARGLLTKAVEEDIVLELVTPDVPVPVAINRNDVQLALLNLSLNAKHAMPQGGTLRIELRLCPSEGGSGPPTHATLTLTDQGCGIAEADQRRILEPFFSTKGSSGTGLGLPTCERIAKRAGGSLRLVATSSAGSTFELSLPLSDKPTTGVDDEAAPHISGGTEHVLLVEDDPAVRGVVERSLRDAGYVVTAAGEPHTALSLGKELPELELLLTDVRLPGGNGLDLAAQLLSLRPSLSVLVMSAHVEDPAHAEQLSSGAYPFLRKPFSTRELLRTVRQVLEGEFKG